ncbi:MAG: sugar phosphate isomerase/epimerase [Planctomycetota bacterium]|nr:sugar phosphate isomerase/epimerase [Planctomycetota bacterium]
MQFGVCAPIEKSADVKSAGFDFLEESVQSLLQGLVDDAQWTGQTRLRTSALPVLAANLLVPGDLKIVGPVVDFPKVCSYMTNVLRRAGLTSIKLLVFGSAGARGVPEGFDRNRARQQILEFLTMVAPLAAQHKVTLVVEPLNSKECNIITTVGEAMTYIKEINQPSIQCLIDAYHYWLDSDSPTDLKAAMPWIRHVHVADKEGRLAPGESGKADYRPFFRILKDAGYDAGICVEALGFNDFKIAAPRVLAYLKKQWQNA